MAVDVAPIALFVYNRPRHTMKTIKALAGNDLAEKSRLVIYSDGPRNDMDDRAAVSQVRRYIREITGFREVEIIERAANAGLSENIISGVTKTVNEYGRVIVLEDDLVSSPFFLRYMNDALDFYAANEKVISVHAYVYPVKDRLPETFFLRGADCWGWATWKRGWRLFERDGRKLLNLIEKKGLAKRFDYNGAYGFTRMLRNQVLRKQSSWAIRWHAAAFLKDRLTLYPGRSLIQNIGIDGSGIHSGSSDRFSVRMADSPVRITEIPVSENPAARAMFETFFRSLKPSLPVRLASGLKRTIFETWKARNRS